MAPLPASLQPALHGCLPLAFCRVPACLQAARPADLAEQTRLQTQAFEAINEVVRASAADTTPMVVQLLPLLVGKLQETLSLPGGSAEAAERQREIQVRDCVPVCLRVRTQLFWVEAGSRRVGVAAHLLAQCEALCVEPATERLTAPAHLPLALPWPCLQTLLCGATLVIVQKLSEGEATKAGVKQYADQIMETLLAIFACRKASVHEEAMLAVVSAGSCSIIPAAGSTHHARLS